MGPKQSHAETEPKKEEDIFDILVETKVSARMFALESRRAEKSKNKEMLKAKKALARNDEEGARFSVKLSLLNEP
jgi:hypothetical protein